MINKWIMPKGFRIESLSVEKNNIKRILVSVIGKLMFSTLAGKQKLISDKYLSLLDFLLSR